MDEIYIAAVFVAVCLCICIAVIMRLSDFMGRTCADAYVDAAGQRRNRPRKLAAKTRI